MSKNVSRAAAAARPRKKTRNMSLLLVLAAIVVVVTLLWTEQIAVLYVLVTISMAVLLIVVAMADLHLGERPAAADALPYNDSAGLADAAGTTAPVTLGAATSRSVKSRRKR